MITALNSPKYHLLSDEDLLKQCEITTMRSSGAGGQHVNTTESAVRIRHLPTGIVVREESSRSQFTNRRVGLERLKVKLAQLSVVKPKRIPTKKTKASQKRRLDEKSHRSKIKKDRSRFD